MENEKLFLEGNALYEKGELKKAFEIFLRAATLGDTSSMTRVASMYTCGEGVNCDYDKAIEWELKAAGEGDVTALFNLGISYRIKGDIRNSKSWFEKALQAGDASAAIELAKLVLVSDKEIDTAIAYLNAALENKPTLCESEIQAAETLLLELGAKH
jgi:TPR repeat protein